MSEQGIGDARPLRIAMFTEAYPPIISGVAMATRTLVEGLRELGHEVDLYAPNHPEQPDVEGGVSRLPSLAVPIPGWIPISLPMTAIGVAELAATQYDIAHTQHPFLLGNAARSLARRLDIPLFVTLHTQYEQYVHYWTPWSPPGRWIVRQIIREYCNTCDQCITVAAGMRDLLHEYGVTTPIEVIPNDLDVSRFLEATGDGVREKLGLAPDELFLLSLGRLGAEKNLLFMLDAVAPLLREGPAKRLVFVGDGPLRAELERRVETLNLGSRVLFTGKIEHEETPRYYAAADLFLMASVTEVNPLTIGEALAAGTPVVAVDCFSARDAVTDGRDGLLVPQEEPAFRSAVESLAMDAQRLGYMSANAREAAADRNASHAVERTLALYQRMRGKGHAEVIPPAAALAQMLTRTGDTELHR